MSTDSKQTSSIRPFFEELIARFHSDGMSYCICGNYAGLPDFTENDIDIWVSDPSAAYRTAREAAAKTGYRLFLSNSTANGTNNFYFAGEGGEIRLLHVDLLVDCSWASTVTLVPSHVIKANLTTYNGFQVANKPVEAVMHLLYPLIQYKTVKKQYLPDFEAAGSDPVFAEILCQSVGNRIGGELLALVKSRDWDGIVAKAGSFRRAILRRALLSRGCSTLATTVAMLRSVLSRFLRPSGLAIAVIGPDGAGKTTTLCELEKVLTKACPKGKFRTQYWRPFLLPELNRIIPLRKPVPVTEGTMDFFYHREKEIGNSFKKKLIYHVKFLYYSLDFMLGALKVLSVKARGGIVCFDRFYYDHIVYPERFGFRVGKPLMLFLERFIYKADLVFLLDPPNEVLLARKQEVPVDELVRQKREYHALADRFGFRRVDTSISPSESVNVIATACLERMSARYRHER